MDNRKKLHNGNLVKASTEQAEDESAKIVQCHIRGILARKEIEKMREEEMIFLGMKRKPKSDEEIKNDPIKDAEVTRANRKAIQEAHWEEFVAQKKELKEEIEKIEGEDITETMLKERRDWVQRFRAEFGKVPDNLDKYYERHNVLEPLSPEEEEKKNAEDEENAKSKKDKKKAKKSKKAAGGDGDDKPKMLDMGPTEVVRKFEEFYEGYNVDWANRDERDNKQ